MASDDKEGVNMIKNRIWRITLMDLGVINVRMVIVI